MRAGALSASIYLGQAEPLARIATITNSQALPPGGSSQETLLYKPSLEELNVPLLWRVVVDEDEQGEARYNECREENNATAIASFVCQSEG